MLIYHNPRCRKSREGLQYLRDNNVEPEIVEYMKTPLKEKELMNLSKKLGLRPKEFIRRQEKDYKDLLLKEKLNNDAALFSAMASHPKLIERPIVVNGDKAVLGRPAENIKVLL